MNVVWMVVGLGVVGVVLALLRWRGSGREADLGSVSQQWVAENRMSQQHEPPR